MSKHITYVQILFADLSAECIELTSALKSKQPGKNTSMRTGSNAKGSDDAKQKSGKNTSM